MAASIYRIKKKNGNYKYIDKEEFKKQIKKFDKVAYEMFYEILMDGVDEKALIYAIDVDKANKWVWYNFVNNALIIYGYSCTYNISDEAESFKCCRDMFFIKDEYDFNNQNTFNKIYIVLGDSFTRLLINCIPEQYKYKNAKIDLGDILKRNARMYNSPINYTYVLDMPWENVYFNICINNGYYECLIIVEDKETACTVKY